MYLHVAVLHSDVNWVDMETGCSGRKKQPSFLGAQVGDSNKECSGAHPEKWLPQPRLC